jgi:hypothetical protein
VGRWWWGLVGRARFIGSPCLGGRTHRDPIAALGWVGVRTQWGPFLLDPARPHARPLERVPGLSRGLLGAHPKVREPPTDRPTDRSTG